MTPKDIHSIKDRRGLIGKKFGRLTVLDVCTSVRACWLYTRCDCGSAQYLVRSSVLRGHTKSCGCLARDATEAMKRAARAIT